MSLDIGIGGGLSPMPDRNEPMLQLEADGYYFFLHPLIGRLAERTGQYIDLYGDASFAGGKLNALAATVAEAKQLVAAQPAAWKVHTGTQIAPVRKAIFHTVDRSRFLDLLEQFERIITKAASLGRPVVCFGD